MSDSQEQTNDQIIMPSVSKIRETINSVPQSGRMSKIANGDDDQINFLGNRGLPTFQIPLMGVSNEDDDPVDVLVNYRPDLKQPTYLSSPSLRPRVIVCQERPD